MLRYLQSILLVTYRIVFVRGLLRCGWGQRFFFMLYHIYKARIEAGNVEILQRWIPAGGRVIDVGANIGFFTIRFADWVGLSGQVIALEPELRNFAELERRVYQAGFANTVLLHRAVADRLDGWVRLEINPNHPGDHKIGAEGSVVKALSVDSLCLVDERPVALIKIDVQGAEQRVLEGARGVLMRDRPKLFVELDARALSHFGTNITTVLSFLDALGYCPHSLSHCGIVPVSRAKIDEMVSRRGYLDVLFLADDSTILPVSPRPLAN